MHQTDSKLRRHDHWSNAVPLSQRLQLPESLQIFDIYALTLLMYTVASPDPDHNPGREGQLPNPNECNSTLTSRTRGETLTRNPNECNSTLTSGTSGGAAPTYTIYTGVRGQLSNPNEYNSKLVPHYYFGSEVSLPCAKIVKKIWRLAFIWNLNLLQLDKVPFEDI